METSTSLPEGGARAAPLPGAATEPEPPVSTDGPQAPPRRASTRLAQALSGLAGLGERFGDDGVAEEARSALLPLEENLLRMVALGQFKRGKSTLLNALLDVPILPMGIAPVTSVATLVRWAPTPRLAIYYATGEAEQAEIERLPDFVVEGRNPGNALGVRLVEVGCPASLLEDGLVLVDTPGIGSTDRRVTERAYGFLPSVDAGLVVLSPDPPVGEAEAAYVRELATLTPHLLFVLNKVDRVPEAEWREVLSFNRQVLADVLMRDPEDIDIVPVSARRALEDGDRSVAALRDRILGFLTREGSRVREELAGRRLRTAGARLRARLDVERRALDLEERELDARIEGLRRTLASLERRAERASRAVMAAVDERVGRAGDELLAHGRSGTGALAVTLCDTVRRAPARESNTAVASRFDRALADGTWQVLDAWWDDNGPGIVAGLLDELERAADDLAEARREAAAWIREAFGVALPEEPRVEALKESRSFYRRVEGVTPRLTVDLLGTLLPRGTYRACLRRRAHRVAAQALDMGAGQVRGDLLYRARETARGLTAHLRVWTVAGLDGLENALERASALRCERGRAAESRRSELDGGLTELEDLLG